MNEKLPTKKVLENVKYFLKLIFLGLLFGIFSLAFLAFLLQWTLGIDITKFDKIYRLEFVIWIGWVIGLHVKSREDDRRRMLKG